MNTTQIDGTIQGYVQENTGTVIINYYAPTPPPPTKMVAIDLPPCPYRGLFAFRPEDKAIFFGRERAIAQLVTAVNSRTWVATLGASGSGKSSVVFAGLVPTLDRANQAWLFSTFRPTDDPFNGLANALLPLYEPDLSKTKQMAEATDLANYWRSGKLTLTDVVKKIEASQPNRRLLLIADQFEELYTLTPAEQRQPFLDLLLQIAHLNRQVVPVHFLFTMRADFLGQASLYRPFTDMLQDKIELLGPMTREEMSAAIIKPAELADVTFEEQLVEQILDDVGAEEGNLPLLEFALTELWQRQQLKGTQRLLTHTAYHEIGEVKGALSRHADAVYQTLSPSEQAETQRIFMRLVKPGHGSEDTRQVATQTQLAEQWALVSRLASARLLVTNQQGTEQETVEVVHEALIRHWQPLRHWIEANRRFLEWQTTLQSSLQQWQSNGQDTGALLRGAPLTTALEWQAKQPTNLSREEHAIMLSNLPDRVSYNAQGVYFLVHYTNSTAEVWREEQARLLTRLGSGLGEFGRRFIFDEPNDRLIVWYQDERVYLFDLAMLSAIRPGASLEELRQLGCKRLSRGAPWFKESDVEPYLFGATAQGCR